MQVEGWLVVLDLLTGQRLWHLDMKTEDTKTKNIEADPAIADLNGDGVLDILIAAHNRHLTAVSGHVTKGARYQYQQRQNGDNQSQKHD